MAIAAHWETPNQSLDPRADTRRCLALETIGGRAGAEGTEVTVHNASTSGMLIECGDSLAIGERLSIALPEAGEVAAEVVWGNGRFYGCRFTEPVSAATLSAAQLRSANDAAHDPMRLGVDDPAEGFGRRLQRMRKQRGLTLAQVADGLGVSKPTVWAWEQGRAKPLEERIETLATILGVNADQLMPGSGTSALQDLVTRSRERIAASLGISPERVRISIDL